MSVFRCCECDRFQDSDFDPEMEECEKHLGGLVCSRCLERRESNEGENRTDFL